MDRARESQFLRQKWWLEAKIKKYRKENTKKEPNDCEPSLNFYCVLRQEIKLILP